MMRLMVVALVGCGRIHFDTQLDAAVECSAWSTPQLMPAAIQGGFDWYLTPAQRGAHFYFFSYRGGGFAQIFETSQAGGTFTPPTPVSELNDPSLNNGELSVTDDDTLGVFTRFTDSGVYELWSTQRARPSDPWGAPELRGELNDDTSRHPDLGRLGDYIYFVRMASARDLWWAITSGAALPYGMPHAASELNTPYDEATPAFWYAHQELFFSSNRPGGPGGYDVYRATKPTPTANWDPPVLVPELSSPGDDWGLRLSADGTTMYLSYDSSILGMAGAMYFATRTCP